MTRRVPAKALAVREPVPPSRKIVRPAWATTEWRTAHAASYRTPTLIEHVQAGNYRIPIFQRPWTWSDVDVVALLNSLFRCTYIGTLLVWERDGLPPSVERFGDVEVHSNQPHIRLVIDGQQRLSALMVAVYSGQFFFDLRGGCFVVGDAGPWQCPASHLLSSYWIFDGDGRSWSDSHAAEHGLDRCEVKDSWLAAFSAMDRSEVHVCVLNHRWDLAAVVENYRLINTTGVRMSAEDLEAGLVRAGALSAA